MAMPTFEQVTQEATQIKRGWCPKLAVWFEYFNPNGLIAKKAAFDDKITEAVDQGRCASGAILAYGSLNSYHADRMQELARKTIDRKRVSRIDVLVVQDGLERDIESARKFLESLGK